MRTLPFITSQLLSARICEPLTLERASLGVGSRWKSNMPTRGGQGTKACRKRLLSRFLIRASSSRFLIRVANGEKKIFAVTKPSAMRSATRTVLLVSLLAPCCALVNVAQTRQPRRSLATPTRVHGIGAGDSDDDHFDVELVRWRLEAMMMGSEDSPFTSSVLRRERPFFGGGGTLPEAPPLTAIAKERRVAEIQLLSDLIHGDESLDGLWSLWFSERGPHAANELRSIEELIAQGPRSWGEAEERLRDLIDEHGPHFVEPVNRLATLLFLQGRLEESKILCESVLVVKPWHFGALSGIVIVCAGLGDTSAARQWAARRLPPIQPTGSNKRRAQWVERSVEDAAKALFDAERCVKKAFGKPDEQRLRMDKTLDDDSWQ